MAGLTSHADSSAVPSGGTVSRRSPSGEIAETRDVVREEGGGAIERRENKVFVLLALCVHEPCDYGERATRCKIHDQACL